MVHLYTDYIQRKYYANSCSQTCLFALLILFCTIMLPFFLAFSTNSNLVCFIYFPALSCRLLAESKQVVRVAEGAIQR